MTILVMTQYYLPGNQGGGTPVNLRHMTEEMGDEFQFNLLTSDRDCGNTFSYPNIQTETWQKFGKARVMYLSSKGRSWSNLCRLLKEKSYDIVYLNSFFSFGFSIKPMLLRHLHLVRKVPVILVPRGEFSRSALSMKSVKKQVYLRFAKLLRLYSDVSWQASSSQEADDIRVEFPHADTRIVTEFAPAIPMHGLASSQKRSGRLRVITLGRICPMKNTLEAISLLAPVKGLIEYTICGPIEDAPYWDACQKKIRELPSNVQVSYHPPVHHDKVLRLLGEYDLFFLPSLAENFSHVILEAFIAGTPVLISDRTPWQQLEENKAGWDIPLSNTKAFHQVLDRCVAMDDVAFRELRNGARRFGIRFASEEGARQQTRQLFARLLNSGTPCLRS